MSTTDDTNATRRGSGSNDLLGQASEALPLVERLRLMSRRGHWPLLGDEAADEIERLRAELARCGGDNCMGRRCDDVTNWVTEQAAQARVAAERERCAKPVPDEWLVKVRRLVEGFEHVSGIARLWEPDYSSGNERALWARATEACADVAKLLRDVGKA